MITDAKLLRNKQTLETVPSNPGWYRWWCKENIAKQLLGAFAADILEKLTRGENELSEYYLMYVGIAVKESLRARLNWHVNQKHTLSCVKSGVLSTFRQSISSLVAEDQSNEKVTNEIIDHFKVEYFPCAEEIKSDAAKTCIENKEKEEIVNHILPLNIQHNQKSEIQYFMKHLKERRKNGKIKGMARFGK
ncbi:MAG: hypothetical protein LBR50_00660 [Tannerella sp.]|jgi:hypothetical protein|nr:hypothetical protein [Tannerella sp.]